jgi:hypothetical protein
VLRKNPHAANVAPVVDGVIHLMCVPSFGFQEMDSTFANLISPEPSTKCGAVDEIMSSFHNSDFFLAMVRRLSQDPGVDDSCHLGLVFSILGMVRDRVGSRMFTEGLPRLCFAQELFPLLFELPPPFRPFILEACRLILNAHCPLGDCALYCILRLSNAGSPLDTYCTAALFLSLFLRFFPVDLDNEELVQLFQSCLTSVALRLGEVRAQGSPLDYLRFASTVSSCLRRFFPIDELNSLGLISAATVGDFLNTLDAVAIALRLTTPENSSEDRFQIAKMKARILKFLRGTVQNCVGFDISSLCASLAELSLEGLVSNPHHVLKTAFLNLLLAIMKTGQQFVYDLSSHFTPTFLLPIAVLTEDELAVFADQPARYLSECLLFGSSTSDYGPRLVIAEILRQMDPADSVPVVGELFQFASDSSYYEAFFFLLGCIADAHDITFPDSLNEQAVSRLAREASPAEAAAILLFFYRSRVEFPGLPQLAEAHILSADLVLQHVGLHLLTRCVDIRLLDNDASLGLAERLINLAVEAWDPHLLPIFATLVASHPELFAASAHEILTFFAEIFSRGGDASHIIGLICSLLTMLPDDHDTVTLRPVGKYFNEQLFSSRN